jgi:hypothetical protein
MLNAVPRKTGALVRSFNTAMVMPLGQGVGALLLVILKGVALPWLLPALGLLITAAFIFYSYKQNTAYGEALLDLLKEDRIHLLDLEDDDIRQFDGAAVAAISERLKSEQDEAALAVIELLRTIGSPQARSGIALALALSFTACHRHRFAGLGSHWRGGYGHTLASLPRSASATGAHGSAGRVTEASAMLLCGSMP